MPRSAALLSVILLATGPLLAQVVSTASVTTLEQTYTTGMVGVVASQTAQLNVLNISQFPATSSTTSSTVSATTSITNACTVQLSFYDSQNRLIKQSNPVTVAPGAAVSLTLGRTEIPTTIATTPRVQIRGVVTSQQSTTTGASTATAVISSNPFLPVCSLVTTLELFDAATGVTQMFTSDVRAVSGGYVVPLTGVVTNK